MVHMEVYVCVYIIQPLALSRCQRLLWSPLMDAQLESDAQSGSQGHSHCLSGPHHLAEVCSLQSVDDGSDCLHVHKEIMCVFMNH